LLGKLLKIDFNIRESCNVFNHLVDLPAKKHHCIQLAVKSLHKAIDEYKNGHSDLKDVGCQSVCSAPQDCCKSNIFQSS
jgi:hypothetical protein